MIASEFHDAYQKRHELGEGWKRTGKRILGYYCNYTPEELIHAAGIVPVRIRGSSQNVELADAHLPSFCCSYMRSALDQALKGRYSYLSGAVFPKSCDMMRANYSIWKRNIRLPYYWNLPVPGKTTDQAVEFFTQELRLFKGSLEGFTGQPISDESLRAAIRLYNENRSLVAQVYELSLSDTPPLSGSERFGLLLAGLVLPKDEHNTMLRELLGDLPISGASSDGVRLLLAGNTFESVGLMDILEEAGGRIVVDDIDIGTRYYGFPVAEDSEPIRALAERYLRKTPCPCKHPAEPRLARILELAREYRVKGVVLVVQKYCDTHLYDRPWLESRLTEEGLPVLVVDHSDTGWVGGKFKTMAQAFIEMLE